MTQPTQTTENAIQAAGAAVAPRIKPDDIKANIASEHYFTAADGAAGAFATERAAVGMGMFPGDLPAYEAPLRLLTFCVLVLKNGFTVTGESACASPENFNADIGRRIARENAVAKIWPLMGYELRTRIANGRTTIADRSGLMEPTESLSGKLDGDQPIPGGEGDSLVHAMRAISFQDRVRAECKELEARLCALNIFIAGEIFDTLPTEEKQDMLAQAQAMATYLIQLQRRIYRFDKQGNAA